MHPDRGIVRMYRRSDGLYTIPGDHNTLTCQSADTNNAPRDPLHSPITGYGALEFHTLHRDPIECDSSERRGVVHRHSIPPPHPPPCFTGEGGSPLIILYTSSPTVNARCLMFSFSASRMARPNHLSLLWSRPGSHLAETLLSMSLHVSSNIHELWRATRLSSFVTVRRNSVKILTACVLAWRPGGHIGRRVLCSR